MSVMKQMPQLMAARELCYRKVFGMCRGERGSCSWDQVKVANVTDDGSPSTM